MKRHPIAQLSSPTIHEQTADVEVPSYCLGPEQLENVPRRDEQASAPDAIHRAVTRWRPFSDNRINRSYIWPHEPASRAFPLGMGLVEPVAINRARIHTGEFKKVILACHGCGSHCEPLRGTF